MNGAFRLRTHLHTSDEVRDTRWTGRRGARYDVLDWADLLRAGIFSSIATRPDVDALRMEGEVRAAHTSVAFKTDGDGTPFLRATYAESLRDSSRAGRAGDFGQAVGWLMTQQILGLPYVVDYEQFCKAVGHPHVGASRRPDYVAFASLEATRFTLVECKGRWYTDVSRSTPGEWRAVLTDAHKQCESAWKHFARRPVLRSRGMERLVSIAALAHVSGPSGLVAHAMEDKREVDEWQLSNQSRRSLSRLVYRQWGAATGNSDLLAALTKGTLSDVTVRGEQYGDGGSAHFLPWFANDGGAPPFVLSEMALGLQVAPARPRFRHAIARWALRRALGYSQAKGAQIQATPPQPESRIRTYGDGTAVVDTENLEMRPRTLAEFVEGDK
ncbi:hypothetical protein [Gemmatimonas sp.]|uniref:hypothetical protein n=1 Tax=Gemmatimonas sp. TaxID=1962908 RepID=UPI003DA33A5A